MDQAENKLHQFWKNFRLNSTNDPVENQKKLIELLDCCVEHFSKVGENHVRNDCSDSITTYFYIGNLLIHRFLLDLNDLAGSVSENIESDEYNLFREYFFNGIGWKILLCFSYFNEKDGSISNYEFSKILILILKTFMINYTEFESTDGPPKCFDIIELLPRSTLFKEEVYLKTLKNEFLSPAKVKSWIRSLKTNSKRKQENHQCDSDEENFDPKENHFKNLHKNDGTFSFYCTNPSIQSNRAGLDLNKDRCMINVSECDKPSPEKLINTIENILMNSLVYEYHFKDKNDQEFNGGRQKISYVIIDELFFLVDHLIMVNSGKSLKPEALKNLKQFMNLILASCLINFDNSGGIKLIHRHHLMQSFQKYVDFLLIQLKENISDEKVVSILLADLDEIICLLLRFMITMSQSLIHHKETEIFQLFMRQIFEMKIEKVFELMIKFFERQKNYESIYRIVDLLKELQVTIQHSQSLILHKQICTKKKHKRCNLVPLMAHHFFHEASDFRNKEKGAPHCCSSLVYCLLIKLIFICSSQTSSEDEKLLCHIGNQLSFLISCCCSLKKYCKNLLHFAINTNRTNLIRNSIFQIIEFNVKIQRKHFGNSTFLTDQCSFCSYHDICEENESEDNNDSIFSEGYSTDNGQSSLDEFQTSNVYSESNCLIKTLSTHYLTLFKCDNSSIRQTVFRHLFNLFSYLNVRSRKSILLHIIFPILGNHKSFTCDVVFFVFRLLITMTKECDQQSDNIEPLNLLVKMNALPSIKQFISWNSFLNKTPFTKDFYGSDLFSLSFELFENLIKWEVVHFSKTNHNLSKTDIDAKLFYTVPLLIEMFIERFDDCIKFDIMQHFPVNCNVNKLDDGIDFYRTASFNIFDMDEIESSKFHHNLLCLSKLLSIANNILKEFPFFKSILNHDEFNFSHKLFTYFQKYSILLFNKIKLLYCFIDNKQENNQHNSDYHKQKRIKFCQKLLKVFEQLLFFAIHLEPFNLNEDFVSDKPTSNFMAKQLSNFLELNLLTCRAKFSNSLIIELLKILIRVSFGQNENFSLNRNFDNHDTFFDPNFVIRQPRTSSLDSVMSDNETPNDLDLDTDFDGYDADIECPKNNQSISYKKKQFSQYEISCDKSHGKISPLLRNVDMCRVVFKYLGDSLHHNSQSKVMKDNPPQIDLNIILTIINLVLNYCRENPVNNQILFENNFTQIIIQDFKLLLSSTNLEDKPVKIALFDLFIQLTRKRLKASHIKDFIELFKFNNTDFEFLLSIFNKILFPKQSNFISPQHCFRFPASKSNEIKNKDAEIDWIDRVVDKINDNYTNYEYEIGFKSFAYALPLIPFFKHNRMKYSLVFWIYLEKIPPLVDKKYSFSQESRNKSLSTSENRIRNKNKRQIHIITFVFNSVILEIWFDYVYNRFIYRICKESNGKMIYLNESFVPSTSDLLGQWNFICVDLVERCDPNNRSHSIQVGHIVNCSKEKVFKWSYPAAIFNCDSKNNALLIGSCQEISDFSFNLSSVFLFKNNLPSSTRVLFYSLGPDFDHFHHLEDETIMKNDHFVLPQQLVNESNVDILTSLLQTSVSTDSRFLVDNIMMVHKVSRPNIFFLFQSFESNSNFTLNPLRLLATSNKLKNNMHTFHNENLIFPVKFNCKMEVVHNNNISKITADTGGISIFIFLFLYLLEKSDNQNVFNKALELILNVYNSHYYHKLMFDSYHGAYPLLMYVLDKCQRPLSSNVLRTYSQFAIYTKDNNSLILSSNINTFIDSWKIWLRSPNTTKQFFLILNSLVIPSNPFRNFNVSFLKKIGSLSHLIHLIEDIHINYIEDYFLDFNSSEQLVSLIQAMIDDVSDYNLLKMVLKCLLLLQNSEWLHVNQTKASFYFLFPSTWLSCKEDNEIIRNPVAKTIELMTKLRQNENDKLEHDDSNMDDWEIVSEFFENTSPLSDHEIESQTSRKVLPHANPESITCELILLVNKYLDQITDVSVLDSIFENVSCLDFLVVLVNNPSENVREKALKTFFKLFKLHFDKKENSDINETTILKQKTLYLLMVSNQLYNYIATEKIMNSCLSFVFNICENRVNDLFSHDCDQTLIKKIFSKIYLENFIPFLALLPKSIPSISYCFEILQLFHKIIEKMSIHQINELQKEYGLIQSISKLVINLNTQLSIPIEDINKYTKEHLNEEVYRIIYSISINYILHDDPQYYINFLNFNNYYSIMERKVNPEVSQIFRQIQITIFQASFEAFDRFQTYMDPKYNYQELGDSLRRNSRSSTGNHSRSLTSQLIDVQPKIMLERFKIMVRKSIIFIMCRDHNITLCHKEKYFQREILYHLLKIIDQTCFLENSCKKSEKNSWTKLISSSKDFFKSHLNRVLLFLVSNLQTIDDRVFALHLFFEKTKEFEMIKFFLDKNDDQFVNLFDGYIQDLINHGVKELDIYSAPDEFVLSTYDDEPNQELLSMDYVLKKFKEQLNLTRKNNSNNKSILVSWLENLQEIVSKYENEILRSSNKVFTNMTIIFHRVLDSAKSLNDRITPAQHKEKKIYISHLKQKQMKTKLIKKKLSKLIASLMHEKTCWFIEEYYPKSWELSPFECHGRIRKKLERCFLEIDNRYVMNPSSKKLRSEPLFSKFMENNFNLFNSISLNELDQYIQDDKDGTALLHTASVILYDDQIEGEILIKSSTLQFVANIENQKENCLSFSSKKSFFQNFVVDFNEIQEILKCRYELQNKAMEIVLTSGLTYLICFESTNTRDECHQHLMSNRDLLPNLLEGTNLVTLAQMWRERLISNFDYLMQLNKLSGRSFNDLMQYPVFPFVLADYHSDILNLLDKNSFRDLSRPIAVQKKEREKYYVDQYNYIKAENSQMKDRNSNDINSFQFIVTSAPYHYGAHYSNSGIVLYYLVRLPPYTQMFLQYQDKNFDIPDRSFHSIQTTWRLATEDSTNGFKELIPEFFYLPEFLMNTENFNLGVRQNGERVHDVILPPWCRNNPRLFTLINLQALESNYVTQNLNHWFDLIFGYKQTGRAAIEAVNVFHPATHFTADLSKIEDEVKRHALKTMIKTFGQMPNQLFNLPHPSILSDNTFPIEDDHNNIPESPSMGEVIGLKWGSYVGSPLYNAPVVFCQKKFPLDIDRVLALPTNDVLLLPSYSSTLVVYNQPRNIFINTSYILFYALCTWSPETQNIWFLNQDTKCIFTAENSLLDEICICETIPDYDWLMVGYRSGIIVAFPLKINKILNIHDIKLRDQPIFFFGHDNCITSITINNNYNVALSTDQNGTCIVWDMNKQQYLRTILDRSGNPAMLSAISNTMGDLAVITYSYRNMEIISSKLNVFTLNGSFIGDLETEENCPYFTCLCYSTCQEGLSINVIATGMSNGIIKLWSSWDLTLVRQVKLESLNCPIKSISFSFKCDLLYIVNNDNFLVVLKNGSLNGSSASTSNSLGKKSDNFRLLNLTKFKNLHFP